MPKIRSATRSSISFLTVSRRLRLKRASRCRRRPELGKSPVNVVSQTSGQNPEISPQNSPEQMQNEIQNTLYESDDRIYDLQSYPDNDINQIENRGNAVTNYPEY